MRQEYFSHKEHGLCLTWKFMLACSISENTLKSNSRNGGPIKMIDHPHDGRKKLIVWELLSPKYKSLVSANLKIIVGCKHDFSSPCRCDDPFEYFSKKPIRELFEMDSKAETFYRTRMLEMNINNFQRYVDKYTLQASWLKIIIKFRNDKVLLKDKFNMNASDFTKKVWSICESDNTGLPKNYRDFRNKISEFKSDGYECLVSDKFGNANAAKIGKSQDGFDTELHQKQIALIRSAASKHNNFNAQQITDAVNKVFASNGWTTVSHTTVYNLIKANEHLTIAGSRGKRVYNNEISMQVKRRRPVFPLQYFTLDGWTVELAYQDKKGNISRLVAVVVLDVMNNYPIGYAIGERENADLIREANRNALIHTKELFGDYYRPWQLQSDNFAIKQNTPFFEAMTHLHTPAAVGNAKAKVIEPYFKDLNKNYCQRSYNWTGFNIDAQKRNQVNREFSDKIKKNFPSKEELVSQIDAIFYQERALKIERYMKQFKEMPATEKVTLERKDWLLVFGKPTGYTNSLHGLGIITTLKGKKLVYDSFDPAFRSLQHLNWKVVYDEHNLESILAISEDDKHRFVLDQKRSLPMDVRSMTTEDHSYLSQIREYNKKREQEVIQTYIDDAELVQEVLSNTIEIDADSELALKGMFTYSGQQKERLQDAKGLKKQQQKALKFEEQKTRQSSADWQASQIEYWKSKTDFNKYLD